jgi:hypothetical protein
MDTTEETVISEELWRVWLAKDRLRNERAAARKLKIAVRILLSLLAIGGILYFVILK